ncbi:hypothetical protein M9Y10_035743 [Tritrichomonas musculus]|uniref:Protein kinase domain-containing protein n=1 Tax=Tritrichomonas musculus TaxID=1915356 RepID=A0ABR2GWK7_9EUKA
MEDLSFTVIPNMCSINNIKDPALLKIYNSFQIKFIPFAVYSGNFNFFISNADNSLVKQLQHITENSKFITYMYSNLYQSVYLSQKNNKKDFIDTEFGIEAIICFEGHCHILEKVDIQVVEKFFSKIQTEKSMAIINASCKFDRNNEKLTKIEIYHIKKEIENFCNYFSDEIEQNKFIECTIRPISCYMIRRYFYPTDYFTDQRFFTFNFRKEKTKNKTQKKSLKKTLIKFMKSDCPSYSVPYFDALQEEIEEEDINNNEPLNYKNFKQNDFITLRDVYRNDTSIFYLVFHIETFYIFLLKKVINLDTDSSSFKNEVNFCKNYSHRCFMRFYGFLMNDEDIQGFVYEYLCNNSLISYAMSHEQKETELYALISINRIYQGIDYLHKNSLIYRDFKPLNILIDHDFYPYITDFETIRMIDEEHEIVNITNDIGSPLYFSPEQYSGDPKLSFSSDIYSFGLIIYYLFEKKDLKKEFYNLHLKNEDHEIPLPHASKNMQEVFQSCIKYTPSERMTHDEIKTHIVEEMSSPSYLEKYLINDGKEKSQSIYIFVYETIRILFDYPEKLSNYLDNLLHYLIIHISYDYDDRSFCFLDFGEYLLRYRSDKNRSLAIKYYNMAAQENNSKASLILGNIYFRGKIVNQDYLKAKEYYEMAANLDDQEAQFKLGFIYHKGLGVKQDYIKAKEYYELAATQNHSEALFKLGNLYKKGHGVKQDYKEARKYYALSSQQQNASAQNKLGELYLFGYGTNKNITKALKKFNQSAENGNAKAYNNLGNIYYYGDDAELDISQAIYYYKLAANEDNPDALYSLGEFFYEGDYVEPNFMKAKKYFESAAEKGNSKALYKLGKIYYKGRGVDHNFGKAKEYFELAAQNNIQKAFVYLGHMHYFGNGVDKNCEKAIEYLELAAKSDISKALYFLGILYYYDYNDYGILNYTNAMKYLELAAEEDNSKASFFLGKVYLDGKCVKQSYEKAKEYFELAAEDDNSEAQHELGVLYYNGKGVERNYEKAKYYFELAAEDGNNFALSYLANMYINGFGTPKDYSKGRYYLELMCENGFYRAFVELGDLYLSGMGDKPNYEKAKECYEIAANTNSQQANFKLGLLYYTGHGVKQDYEKAKKYFELAAREYHPDAFYMLGIIYFYGFGVKKDLRLAKQYFELAANQNNTKSMIFLSDYFSTCEFNISKAIQYLSKCCKMDDVEYQMIENKVPVIIYSKMFNSLKYVSFNDLGLIYIFAVNDIKKGIECIKESAFAEYSFGQNNFGLINQFYLNNIVNAEYMYEKASLQSFSLAEYNFGYLKEKNENIDSGIPYYIKASEHEDVKLKFKDNYRVDCYLNISMLFILCLANLKLTKYYFLLSNFDESKKYFRKSFIKYTTIEKDFSYSFVFEFNETSVHNPFLYLKDFILNFPLFDLKNQSNLSPEIKKQIKSIPKQNDNDNNRKSTEFFRKEENISDDEKETTKRDGSDEKLNKKLKENETKKNFYPFFDIDHFGNDNDPLFDQDSSNLYKDEIVFRDPDQLFDFLVQNKKFQSIFIDEINEIIQTMETITYTPPYPILFGRLNLTKSKPKDNTNYRMEDINELFYEAFE